MGFPRLDVVFGLAPPTIDVFIEPAGRAFLEIGDDKTRVNALIADFDAGDNALDPAPAFGAIVEGLEAAYLTLGGLCGKTRLGAGFEIGDVAAQCRSRRNTQNEVVPASPAPVDDFGAAIVAVRAQQDLCLWPMAADRAHQAAKESPDSGALGPLGRAQYGGDEAALAIEHDNGLEALFVMMGIEQAQLLAAVDGVEGVINIEHNAFGH